MLNIIYVYIDPRNGHIFYVGMSSVGMIRPHDFLAHCGWCLNTLKKLKRLNLKPEIRVVQEFPECPGVFNILCLAERYWIKYFNDLGCPLTNLTSGGERISGCTRQPCSPETKAKISAANTGKIRTMKHRENYSKARIGKHISEEAKRKMSIARKGRVLSEEHKQKLQNKWNSISEEDRKIRGGKISKSKKGHTVSAETRQKISEKCREKALEQWARKRRETN